MPKRPSFKFLSRYCSVFLLIHNGLRKRTKKRESVTEMTTLPKQAKAIGETKNNGIENQLIDAGKQARSARKRSVEPRTTTNSQRRVTWALP